MAQSAAKSSSTRQAKRLPPRRPRSGFAGETRTRAHGIATNVDAPATRTILHDDGQPDETVTLDAAPKRGTMSTASDAPLQERQAVLTLNEHNPLFKEIQRVAFANFGGRVASGDVHLVLKRSGGIYLSIDDVSDSVRSGSVPEANTAQASREDNIRALTPPAQSEHRPRKRSFGTAHAGHVGDEDCTGCTDAIPNDVQREEEKTFAVDDRPGLKEYLEYRLAGVCGTFLKDLVTRWRKCHPVWKDRPYTKHKQAQAPPEGWPPDAQEAYAKGVHHMTKRDNIQVGCTLLLQFLDDKSGCPPDWLQKLRNAFNTYAGDDNARFSQSRGSLSWDQNREAIHTIFKDLWETLQHVEDHRIRCKEAEENGFPPPPPQTISYFPQAKPGKKKGTEPKKRTSSPQAQRRKTRGETDITPKAKRRGKKSAISESDSNEQQHSGRTQKPSIVRTSGEAGTGSRQSPQSLEHGPESKQHVEVASSPSISYSFDPDTEEEDAADAAHTSFAESYMGSTFGDGFYAQPDTWERSVPVNESAEPRPAHGLPFFPSPQTYPPVPMHSSANPYDHFTHGNPLAQTHQGMAFNPATPTPSTIQPPGGQMLPLMHSTACSCAATFSNSAPCGLPHEIANLACSETPPFNMFLSHPQAPHVDSPTHTLCKHHPRDYGGYAPQFTPESTMTETVQFCQYPRV